MTRLDDTTQTSRQTKNQTTAQALPSWLVPSLSMLMALICLIISNRLYAAEFAISPMMIELSGQPGSTENIEFQVHGKQAGTARIFLSQMEQQASGYMAFTPVDPQAGSLGDWLKLDRTRVKVKAGETQTVTGSITIPRRANGNKLLAIMVEEDRPKQDRGVSLNVRYAIVLNLNVKGRKTRLKSEFTDLKVEEQNGQRFVSGWFTNHSNRDARLNSIVSIRDQTRRLIARIPVKTKSAWQREDKLSRVFPGGKVKVYGLIDATVEEGDAMLSVRNKFNGKSQAGVSQAVHIPALISLETDAVNTANDNEEQNTVEPVVATLEILPNPIPVRVNRQGSTFAAIRLRNPLNKPITIELPDKTSDAHDYSFRFTPARLTLEPASSGIVTLRQQFDDGQAQASIYKVKVNTADGVEWVDLRTRL